MITCDFSVRGSTGLCEYLTNVIRNQIKIDILHANEKLPSKRTLAEHLGVSVITVANAYSELIAEGYVYSLEKRGFFVTDLPVGSPISTQVGTTARNTNHQSEQVLQPTHSEWFANFRSNSISYEKFPFSLWSHVMREVLRRPHESLLESAPPQGVTELRLAIASYLLRFRNMFVNPENIVIGAGTEVLYSLVVQLLGRKAVYGVENPGYQKIAVVLAMNGANYVPIDIDEQGMVPSRLEKENVTVVHVSPSHHFPTGIVMPVRRRQELLMWATNSYEHKSRYIIEDDYDSEFRFNGKPLATLQSADNSGSVIYINTFSKSLSPSFRISYMVLPDSLAESFRNQFKSYTCTVSSFEQFALARFMDTGYFEKHLIRMKNYYRTLRNELMNAIERSSFSRFTSIHEENAGLHFLLSVKTKLTSDELKHLFEKEGLNIPLLSDFYYPQKSTLKNSAKNQMLVLNYSGIQKNRIQETVSRMAKVLT